MDTRLMLQAIEQERSRDAQRLVRIAAARPASRANGDTARSRFAFVHAPVRWFAQSASTIAHATKLSRTSRAPAAHR